MFRGPVPPGITAHGCPPAIGWHRWIVKIHMHDYCTPNALWDSRNLRRNLPRCIVTDTSDLCGARRYSARCGAAKKNRAGTRRQGGGTAGRSPCPKRGQEKKWGTPAGGGATAGSRWNPRSRAALQWAAPYRKEVHERNDSARILVVPAGGRIALAPSCRAGADLRLRGDHGSVAATRLQGRAGHQRCRLRRLRPVRPR